PRRPPTGPVVRNPPNSSPPSAPSTPCRGAPSSVGPPPCSLPWSAWPLPGNAVERAEHTPSEDDDRPERAATRGASGRVVALGAGVGGCRQSDQQPFAPGAGRSEEHTSE